jgi:ribonuclease HII
VRPDFLLIDGNRFRPYDGISHQCIVKGDGKMMSIAAASILAKTHRDEFMKRIHEEFPQYGWNVNKGYPTKAHREAIARFGATPYHRHTFRLLAEPSLFPEL